VLQAISELDYSPNLIARSMTSKQTGSIGVIVPFFTRPFFSEVLRGVEVMITQAGREFVLYNVQSNEQCDSYFRNLPKQRKLDGLLIISLYPNDDIATGFKNAGIPVVLVDAYHPQLTSLVVNNIEGAYHEEVQRLMRFDPLTNISNKRHFDESLRLSVFTAAGAAKPLSLIVFDLDHFKKVNDTFGHMAGDAVLCGATAAVQNILSPTELFGRVGGEEFAVVCEEADLGAAIERAEAIRRAVSREPYAFEEKRLPVTVSAGVAQLAGAEEAEGLFDRADAQLYVAKGAGRNCVRPVT